MPIILNFISKNIQKIHKEILTPPQVKLLPLVKAFSKDFGLAGGTAIALLLGHRRSVDFDLFTHKEFRSLRLRRKIVKYGKIERVITDEFGQYTAMVGGVRLTFLEYPYRVAYSKKLPGIIKLPDPLVLGAMKAYALGRRAKWKDYVDLYFIFTKYGGLKPVTAKARRIFGREFNEKQLRTQLAYFKDIDYTEKVDYLPGFKVSDAKIKKTLVDFSLS